MNEITQWVIAALIGTSIAAFLAWFNKSGSDFKDGFESKSKKTKKNKNKFHLLEIQKALCVHQLELKELRGNKQLTYY